MMKKRGRKAGAVDLLAKEASENAKTHGRMGRISSEAMMLKKKAILQSKAKKLRRSRKRLKKARDFFRKKP